MSNVKELAAAIQVGTSRAKVENFTYIPEESTGSTEKKTLLEFATLDLMQRAGALARKNLEAMPLAPTESKPIAHSSSEPLIEAFREDQNLVAEWVREADRKGVLAPPLTLPSFIQCPKRLRTAALPVIGEKGRWLAQLMNVDLEEANTTLHEKFLAEPTWFRNWANEEFENLEWRERAEVLRCLAKSPSSGDEGLLSTALRDKRKEVREGAYEVLALLPGSKEACSLASLAKPLISCSKSMFRRVLNVEPPDPLALPVALPRSGSRSGFGPKGLALLDVVRYSPPLSWQVSTNLSPGELLELAEKSEYSEALMFGWMEAAVRFSDRAWIDAVFRQVKHSGFLVQFEGWPELVSRVSQRALEEVVEWKLDAGELGPLMIAVGANRTGTLSADLSRKIVRRLTVIPIHQIPWRELGYCLDASILPFLPSSEEFGQPDLKGLDRLRKTLDLRNRLLTGLEKQ